MRSINWNRRTKETDIRLMLNLDGSGQAEIHTGIGFFDHMLTAFAVHSGFDLNLRCVGDLEVDCHHTVEDTGIVLGQAFAQLLQDKSGINRYGTASIPMDEALAQCAVDFSGRPFLVFQADFTAPMLGSFATEMTEEFFRALAMNGGITLHLNLLYGKNDHHKTEALFKAAAHGFSQGTARRNQDGILSTKGVLE